MNKNTRTRHLAESPAGGYVDRRCFFMVRGGGIVAAGRLMAERWGGWEAHK